MNPLTGAAAAYTNIVVLSIEPRLQKRVTGIGCKHVDRTKSTEEHHSLRGVEVAHYSKENDTSSNRR